MFNTLLQYQQTYQISPPLPTPSPNSHLWNAGIGSPYTESHNGGQSTPLDADFSKKFRRPHQYAFPLRSSSSIANRTQLSTPPIPRISAPEHMLRRKTPNGTLAAGYDGTSVEWTKRPHAIKHVLMPAPATVDYTAPNFAFCTPYENYIALNRPVVPAKVDEPWNWTRDTETSLDEDAGSKRWAYNISESVGLDSTLNQTPLPQRYHQSAGLHQVPTVLQPVWPPCLGPTASNEQGPYGPYWPNGSFIPYRPAAVRDMRFSSRPDGRTKIETKQWNQDYHDLPNDQHGEQRVNKSHPRQDHGLMLNEKYSSNFGEDLITTPETFSLQNHVKTLDHIRHGTEQVQLAPLVYRGRAPSSTGQSFQRSDVPWSLAPASSISNPFQQDFNIVNGIQSKENVLIWAHGIYVNLLASLHHLRKHPHSKLQSSDRQTSQACIYPKPPGQSFSASRGKQSIGLSNQDSRDVLETREDDFSHHHTFIESTIRGLNDQSDNISNPSQLKSETLSLQRDSGFRGPWQSGQWQTLAGHSLSAGHRSAETFGGHSPRTSPPFISSLRTSSPSADAAAALDILTRLCQESHWQWIDGLLLGGCLAYGLADYDKALQWYSKVLACDPNNVEAISNMAATLLSLNRRNEAEQYWLRSVKLRPSYFEAVEHLIGLLCGDHRGKEAVKVIYFVENALRNPPNTNLTRSPNDPESYVSRLGWQDQMEFSRSLNSADDYRRRSGGCPVPVRFGSSGYAISSADNGRMLALIHAKGNMLYALGDNAGAAKSFEDAILIAAGRREYGIGGLIERVLQVFTREFSAVSPDRIESPECQPILLLPEMALKTAHLVFPTNGQLPGLKDVPDGSAKKAAVSTTSNSLLSLAKIYQDGMSSSGATADGPKATSGVQDILALYYLSLSLQPSPSTANNVGILLAGVQQSVPHRSQMGSPSLHNFAIPGVVPGSGIALALAYYNYGLNLDSRHAHLYTNLGSLLKDIGQLSAAIKMYEQAVACDGTFDIALANLANAVKDQGRISDAIGYYRRAVSSNPEFAEAVCGLANALNSVCNWKARGGIVFAGIKQDRWHVDEQGMLLDAKQPEILSSGWIGRVVAIVEKQLNDGQSWGREILHNINLGHLIARCDVSYIWEDQTEAKETLVTKALEEWAGKSWEGAKVVRLVERATKRLGWQMYQELYIQPKTSTKTHYARPQIPLALAVPSAPTVLPFHTFTCPLTAKQIRKISQRNGLRISCSTLRAPWLPATIYEPPAPPNPSLIVGYVSSDFNNHPLAHLMQSVFGLHDTSRVKAICYATTASDNSIHREQIQKEAPLFHDASSWSLDQLVKQIVNDGVHILINLNGYTRGARNEIFAARPAPVQMSFMGFAGTLGAEWCDYLLADTTAIPPQTLRPWRRNVDLVDQTLDGNYDDDRDEWVYGENIIYTRKTFFCCDHRQSAPDSQEIQLTWPEEQQRRWRMRKEIFPDLANDIVILGNFNQLYKIEPTTFRTWLRILLRIPKAVLWLLRFPDLGERNLRQTAKLWAGEEVASRILFTDVAPKHQHISRARVCDLFLDTPECNAHTTAADVLWSGTPLLTYPRYEYKMCSRMAASILKGALPANAQGDRAVEDLIVGSDEEYEERAVRLGTELAQNLQHDSRKFGEGRLMELRKLLYESRWTSALFDTRRWVRDLEEAYEEAWRRWVAGEGGDIWM